MGDHQDLIVLAIVGLVGAVAIISMASSINVVEKDPGVDFVRAGAPTEVVSDVPQSYTLGSEGDYDLDDDGRITTADSALLADAISKQRCISNKDCDINNDNRIDEQDLAMLNSMLSEARAPSVSGAATSTAPSYPLRHDSAAKRIGSRLG